MTVRLSKNQIASALGRLKDGLEQYVWLQDCVQHLPRFERDSEFRRRYNRFYRVRRNASWQEKFYALMARAGRERLPFAEILNSLHADTNRYEASFASKLLATLDPSKPVIDRFVLRNLGLRLPWAGATNRAARICSVHGELASEFEAFLSTETGTYLVSEFQQRYAGAKITRVKMLDLVLWQTRG